eukprot:gene2390-3232_t
MMKSIVDKLREQEIYCFTFNCLKYTDLKKSGKPNKKMCYPPKTWTTFTKEQCRELVVPKNHYALAILTGEISNLTVIDFDTDSNGHTSYEEVLEDFPELRTCKTVRSCSGGYHIYMYKCDGKKETPYGQNVKNAKNIREAFYCKITKLPDDGFYEKFHVTTKGRLAFLDGVLDFKTKMFYTWEEVTFEYFTTQQINRNFR